jgi:hypothetical protein
MPCSCTEMAQRNSAPAGTRTLAVAGNAHSPTRRMPLGVPMGAHLAKRRPGVRDIGINYGAGHYYNLQPGRFSPISPQPREIRLYHRDGSLILDLPSPGEAVVPQQSRPWRPSTREAP